MNLTTTFKRLLKRKLATAMLVTASLTAFAISGDGGKKGQTMAEKFSNRNFSLRPTYNYRANNLLTPASRPQRFIILNTVVTYQKGNATYILPLKKKVLLDKVHFTFAPSKL